MQILMKCVFAGVTNVINRVHTLSNKYLSISMSLVGLFVLPTVISGPVNAATRQDLQNQITALSLAVDRDVAQDIEVVNAILAVIAPPQSLTLGTAGGVRGTSINVPVYLKASTAPVSGLQFDIPNVAGLTVTGVSVGLAGQASGKSVSGNQNAGSFRVIVFGLNQTVIPSGPVVLLKMTIASNATLGKKVITQILTTATSPTGTTVNLAARNGSVTVR